MGRCVVFYGNVKTQAGDTLAWVDVLPKFVDFASDDCHLLIFAGDYCQLLRPSASGTLIQTLLCSAVSCLIQTFIWMSLLTMMFRIVPVVPSATALSNASSKPPECTQASSCINLEMFLIHSRTTDPNTDNLDNLVHCRNLFRLEYVRDQGSSHSWLLGSKPIRHARGSVAFAKLSWDQHSKLKACFH